MGRPIRTDLEKNKKMSKILFILVSILFASLFTSGSALKCIVCSGGLQDGFCGENEKGTSEECPVGTVCGRGECQMNGIGPVTIKSCSAPVGDFNDFPYCTDLGGPGGKCDICLCNTDNCNEDEISTTKPDIVTTSPNNATKHKISLMGIIALIFPFILIQ